MSDQIILQDTWRPRWYYVMRNKTSGKKYAGQTTQDSMDKYCGSGGYWKDHCKKHGGWNRQNIDAIQQTWIADKAQAQQWLDSFAAENGEYWLSSNKVWANACKETVDDSPFAGLTDDQRKTNGKMAGKIGGKIGGKKNVESGHLDRIRTKEVCSAGGKTAGKIGGKKNVESGHLAKCRKIRAENLRLMSQFCKVFKVSSPGKGFGNIDKAAFQAWKESLTQTAEIG